MSTRTTRTTKRAPRSKAVEKAPVPVTPPAPVKPSYARGNPLTHSVTFVDSSGTCWLVYVEPAPPQPALWPNAAVLPGRRLRFDSLEHSVTVSPFPAGAPFLQEQALQLLLDQAHGSTGHPAVAPAARVATPIPEPRHSVAAPVVDAEIPAPVLDPVRQQLTSMVNSRSGWTYQVSRMIQPLSLVLVVIRDMILPRRG
jgi:hypothetical protein